MKMTSFPCLTTHTVIICSEFKVQLDFFQDLWKLINPSPLELNVVEETDRLLHFIVLKRSHLQDQAIQALKHVLQEVKPTPAFDKNLQDDYTIILIQMITALYSEIFFHQFALVYTD